MVYHSSAYAASECVSSSVEKKTKMLMVCRERDDGSSFVDDVYI